MGNCLAGTIHRERRTKSSSGEISTFEVNRLLDKWTIGHISVCSSQTLNIFNIGVSKKV